MSSLRASLDLRQLPVLLRGEPGLIDRWVEHWQGSRLLFHCLVICAGSGIYGAVMGWWRDPEQALYTALKFPLMILLTTLGNALLNGMLAPLLGLKLRLRQSLLAVLMSFTIASVILAAFSPVVWFVVWNIPAPAAGNAPSKSAYAIMQLTHVAVIAFAGVAANVSLLPLLRRWSSSPIAALKTLLAWLAGNLFLGGQICWVLRPFIGSPGQPVEFLTSHPWEGNIYEAVFKALVHLLGY